MDFDYKSVNLDRLFREGNELEVLKILQQMHLTAHKLELDIKSLVTDELDSILLCVTTVLDMCRLIKDMSSNINDICKFNLDHLNDVKELKLSDWNEDSFNLVSNNVKEYKNGSVYNNNSAFVSKLLRDCIRSLQHISMDNYRLLKGNNVLKSYVLLCVKVPLLLRTIKSIDEELLSKSDIIKTVDFNVNKLKIHCYKLLNMIDIKLLMDVLLVILLLDGQDSVKLTLNKRFSFFNALKSSFNVKSFKNFKIIILYHYGNELIAYINRCFMDGSINLQSLIDQMTNDPTSNTTPVADLREAEGKLNREGLHGSGNRGGDGKSSDVTSGGMSTNQINGIKMDNLCNTIEVPNDLSSLVYNSLAYELLRYDLIDLSVLKFELMKYSSDLTDDLKKLDVLIIKSLEIDTKINEITNEFKFKVSEIHRNTCQHKINQTVEMLKITSQTFLNGDSTHITSHTNHTQDCNTTKSTSNSLPPEVTITVPLAVEASSNYLSLKGITTPRDRGEGSEYMTSSGIPAADLREAEGEVNRRAVCKTTSGGGEFDWPSSGHENDPWWKSMQDNFDLYKYFSRVKFDLYGLSVLTEECVEFVDEVRERFMQLLPEISDRLDKYFSTNCGKIKDDGIFYLIISLDQLSKLVPNINEIFINISQNLLKNVTDKVEINIKNDTDCPMQSVKTNSTNEIDIENEGVDVDGKVESNPSELPSNQATINDSRNETQDISTSVHRWYTLKILCKASYIKSKLRILNEYKECTFNNILDKVSFENAIKLYLNKDIQIIKTLEYDMAMLKLTYEDTTSRNNFSIDLYNEYKMLIKNSNDYKNLYNDIRNLFL